MRRAIATTLWALKALAAVGASASVASATKPDPSHKVTICHATASSSNPYVAIAVDIASIVGDSGHGHGGVNTGDIIPPINMDGSSYAGNNWDDAHRAIFDNGCSALVPDVTTTTQQIITS